jgi:hypothetical protein
LPTALRWENVTEWLKGSLLVLGLAPTWSESELKSVKKKELPTELRSVVTTDSLSEKR